MVRRDTRLRKESGCHQHTRRSSVCAIELARSSDRPIGQVAKGLGISESCLRSWLRRAGIDEGARDGVTSSERKELVELRRRTRQLELENEVLRKAAAYFARENVLPK